MKNKYLSIVLFFCLNGCVSPPSYDIKPEIKFLSLSRGLIDQQPFDKDTVRVEFTFTDGDGDLGFESYDSSKCNFCSDSCLNHPTLSLFVYDNRTNCLSPFNVPYIPPKGSSDAISGTIDLVISSICCIYPDGFACIPSTQYPYDTVIYTLQLKDRAGNMSNKIELPPIVVRCN